MKKISIIAAVVLAAIMTSCGNGTPKANMKSDVDSLCYAIGMAQSQGLKDYLVMRMGVDTTYLNEFIKGLNDGATRSMARTALSTLARATSWLVSWQVLWRTQPS